MMHVTARMIIVKDCCAHQSTRRTPLLYQLFGNHSDLRRVHRGKPIHHLVDDSSIKANARMNLEYVACAKVVLIATVSQTTPRYYQSAILSFSHCKQLFAYPG